MEFKERDTKFFRRVVIALAVITLGYVIYLYVL